MSVWRIRGVKVFKFRVVLAGLATLLMTATMVTGAGASVSRPTAATGHTARGTSAHATDPHLCANYGDTSECVNPQNGQFFDGNTISVTGANYNINPVFVGYVSVSWPFTNTGCDSFYVGTGSTNVGDFQWNADKSFYMRDYTDSNDQVKISDTIDNRDWFVFWGNYYVSVGATDHAGVDCHTTGTALILTYRPDTGTVWSRCAGCYDASKQNWKFEP